MKADITISLAQVAVVKGDVDANLASHLALLEQSAELGADVVVFPELSLTGYELELAKVLAIEPNAGNFTQLSQASMKHNLIVIVGCPLRIDGADKPTIGSVICFPSGDVEFYSKQYLHDGEGEYCSAANEDYLFNVNGHRIGLAICADFSRPEHACRAVAKGADIYLVSALISEAGFAADESTLSGIAASHHVPVLLSNHISQTGGWSACGNNTLWNSNGDVVLSSESKQQGVVLCKLGGETVSAEKHVFY
ncbi:carbon-nitrogen hydrolase family protein [Vibrio fluvialis]|uniref:carbon-nitrogen hydrolase family protein n=1 Tax=Vibrio fluvialis TaxID=676 RepID=UPI0028DE90C5|nr:carbon-nitrogen hydrolase family protein [Vibrio fluvialis]MDT8866758.1 carbon-nitrogen hydrolase family protein [Vibrio fluvialis]MDT8875612.1 carbon-nitrogen hydrolase family protein [Vibrio fluvialis]